MSRVIIHISKFFHLCSRVGKIVRILCLESALILGFGCGRQTLSAIAARSTYPSKLDREIETIVMFDFGLGHGVSLSIRKSELPTNREIKINGLNLIEEMFFYFP